MIFHYDGQIRRYLLQFIRAFSDFKIETGTDDGTKVQTRVPIVYGDPSWMVAQMLKGQSQNTTLPSPMFAAWIADLQMAPERRQDPAYEGHINAIERKIVDGQYTQDIGNRYTIERYMPVPYTLTFQLDIWTTTTTTKLQLFEQIMTVFNPAMQLQQNSNIFDWTSIFELEMTSVQWSNRGVPQGTEQERDVSSFQFTVPIWINPPAKVKRIKMIEQIVTNIHNVAEIPVGINDSDDIFACLDSAPEQIIVTPGSHMIGVGTEGLAGDEIILLTKHGVPDKSLSWNNLIAAYGEFDEYTRLRLKLDDDIESDENDIIGSIVIDPFAPNVLKFTVDADTFPATIPGGPIDAIIDPNDFVYALGAGYRYLLSTDPVDAKWLAEADARRNDIVMWNGTQWIVSFNSDSEEAGQHVTDKQGRIRLTFDGDEWVDTFQGEYYPGYWRLENVNAKKGYDETSSGDDFPMC